MRRLSLSALLILLLVPLAVAQIVEDQDRDGVNDQLEQELLARFLPTFMIASDDCDGLPAEFVAGSSKPIVHAKNGTVYGQVSRHSADENGTLLELHYYHLWARDCGRVGHKLDPEHVSVLVSADNLDRPASAWRARYWYAAAHENTLCDASNAATGLALEAEDHGATVWVSGGKHASFLSEFKCRLGCGENRCKTMKLMQPGSVINIGEPGVPMNGAVWAKSPLWSLKAKMRPDFSEDVIARLEDGENQIISLNIPPPPTQALLLSGNSTFTALVTSTGSAGDALLTGGAESLNATGKALRHTGKSLLLVVRKLRLTRSDKKQ
jgi:hypothetical protein